MQSSLTDLVEHDGDQRRWRPSTATARRGEPGAGARVGLRVTAVAARCLVGVQRRSSSCLQVTQRVADGNAASRSTGMALPHRSHQP